MDTIHIEQVSSDDIKACRLCYDNKPKLVDLFSNILYYGENKETRSDRLNNIIMHLTKLQVSTEDKLPQGVCLQCVSDLFRAKIFIEKCVKTDQILRNGLNSLEDTETENKTEIKDEYNSIDMKDSIVRLDDFNFTFCDSTNDLNVTNIVKIEPNIVKNVDDEILECNSVNDSNDFDLADDMIMSLPDVIVDSKPQEEPVKEMKNKTKVKMKKKKKGSLKSVKTVDQLCDEATIKKNGQDESNTSKRNENRLKITKKMFVCVTCGATLSSKQNLKVHQAIHLDDRPFSCDQCDLKFKLKSHLNGHKRNVHNGEKNHYCSECGKGFFSIAQYKFHMMTHTKEYPHVCVHCDKRFAQKGNLKDHIKTHTGVRDVKCPYCPYITTSTNCLNSHIKGIHKNNKPMQCSECGLRFLYPSGLKRHLTIHTGEKEFQCNHCEKRFRTAEAYKEHIRIHTKEKPYKCRYCEKQCRTYNHRLVHERVHTGNRPYVCQVCKKGFTTNGNLKTHMKTHDKTFE